MRVINKKSDIKYAFFIGGLCSASYLVVYITRSVLSAAAPQLIETEGITNEDIGVISSAFFMFYAVGQLINGILGDKIKGKYMVSLGLITAGVSNLLLSYVIGNRPVAACVYGMLGFFLSMVYAPMKRKAL